LRLDSGLEWGWGSERARQDKHQNGKEQPLTGLGIHQPDLILLSLLLLLLRSLLEYTFVASLGRHAHDVRIRAVLPLNPPPLAFNSLFARRLRCGLTIRRGLAYPAPPPRAS